MNERNGYVINCYLEPRERSQDQAMFREFGDGRVIATLDGYAIIPIEKYKALIEQHKTKEQV